MGVRCRGGRRGRLARVLAGASRPPEGPGQDQPPPGLAASSLLPEALGTELQPQQSSCFGRFTGRQEPGGAGPRVRPWGRGRHDKERGGSETAGGRAGGEPREAEEGAHPQVLAPVPSTLRVLPAGLPSPGLSPLSALCSRRGGFLGGGGGGGRGVQRRPQPSCGVRIGSSRAPTAQQGPRAGVPAAVKAHTVGSAP